MRIRVHVDQCVSAVGKVEVPVFLRTISFSNDTSVAIIRVGYNKVASGYCWSVLSTAWIRGTLCNSGKWVVCGGHLACDTRWLLSRD